MSDFVSLGKQLPPQPGPGLMYFSPILESEPIPFSTSVMSAPTPSQTAAIELIKESFVTRNAFAVYLIVSAEIGSVIRSGASIFLYSSATI